jgi:hypothetical protein
MLTKAHHGIDALMLLKKRKQARSVLSGLAATLFPLRDKIASYPADYTKRAGELIAHGAHSLRQSFPQRKKRKSGKANPQQKGP